MDGQPAPTAPPGPPSPGSSNRPSIADRAYFGLRDQIVTLRLPPGTALIEDALMRELEIGRTPLREAVKRAVLRENTGKFADFRLQTNNDPRRSAADSITYHSLAAKTGKIEPPSRENWEANRQSEMPQQ